MTRPSTHLCPCGCGQAIARTRVACPAGWYRLPADLRDDVNRTWRARRPDLTNQAAAAAHRDAVTAALRWYREHGMGAR